MAASNVHQAINKVMQQVGYVQKEYSDSLRYSFASDAAFIQAVRPCMVAEGLYVYPRDMSAEGGSFTSSRGNVINTTTIHACYRFHHAPSDTFIDVCVVGKGMDSGDKDANKAMTIAFKYALRQTMMIETGDDPDRDPSSNYERGAKEPAKEDGPTKGKVGRQTNQWEKDVIDKIMDLQLVQARPHAVNILNSSVFFDTIPYGELEVVEGVAYLICWSMAKEKYPDDTTEERAARVNKSWETCVDRAIEMLGGE